MRENDHESNLAFLRTGMHACLAASMAFASDETAISVDADEVFISTQLAYGKPVDVKAHSKNLTAYLDLYVDGTVLRFFSGPTLPLLDVNEATIKSGISIMPKGTDTMDPVVVHTQRPFKGETYTEVISTGVRGLEASRQAVQERLNQLDPDLAHDLQSTMVALSNPQVLGSLPESHRGIVRGFNSIGSPVCGSQKAPDNVRAFGFLCGGSCGGALACGIAAAGGIPITGGVSLGGVAACGTAFGGCSWCIGDLIAALVSQE